MTATSLPRVLFLSSGLAPRLGGPPWSEAALCASLAEHAEVTILVRRGAFDRGFVTREGLHAVLAYEPAEMIGAIFGERHWLAKLIRSSDVVHLNGFWRWEHAIVAAFCRKAGIPYVLHPRGMMWVGHRKVWLKRLYNFMLGNLVARGASRVIALSRYETRHFEPYVLKADAVAIVPNGVHCPPLPKSGASGEKCFLYLGRIESRKNLPFLLQAFARYRAQGGTATLRLVGPVERNHDRTLFSLASALGIADALRLDAPVYGNAKWSLLRDAIAVVYPAVEEPFGRVPFETLAVGGRPIVPDRSGAAEYLTRQLPDAIYCQGDEESLVGALRSAEAHAWTEENRASAREWVSQAFSWQVITRDVLAVYESARRDLSSRRGSKSAIAAAVERNLGAGGLPESA